MVMRFAKKNELVLLSEDDGGCETSVIWEFKEVEGNFSSFLGFYSKKRCKEIEIKIVGLIIWHQKKNVFVTLDGAAKGSEAI